MRAWHCKKKAKMFCLAVVGQDLVSALAFGPRKGQPGIGQLRATGSVEQESS